MATLQSVTARRWDGGIEADVREALAEEVPVALSFNGQPYAVMMATPADFEDFALGFAITERLIESPAELLGVTHSERDGGIELRVQVPGARMAAILGRERNLAGRTGCGLCGTATLDAAIRPVARVRPGEPLITRAALLAGMERMTGLQPLNATSGALHAAVVISSNSVFIVREDVGRHNAIDKAVGATLAAGLRPRSLLVTSRASYEVLHKAAEAGCNVVAAVSAPTALALRLAQQSGMTLVGWARPPRLTIYSGELA